MDKTIFTIFVLVENKKKLECAVDGAPSQIPTLKFLTPPPQHPGVPPLGYDPSHRIKILFYIISLICEHTRKVWYKNLWNWHGNWNLMLFDLLTSPQGHQFDPRMKILLALFCSSTRSIWYATWPSLAFIWENTHIVWYKNLWKWHGNWNFMIFDRLTSPQDHQFDPRMKIFLAFCSARHPRQFDMPHDHVWKLFFFTPLASPAPLSPTPGTWPMGQNENPIWYFLYLSFGRTHT